MRYVRRLRLREPFTFFIDECLGRKIVLAALTAPNVLEAGERTITLPQGTLDPTWISQASAAQWACLTKDRALKHRPNELAAILTGHLAVFLVGNGTGTEIAERIVGALPIMRRVLRVRGIPLIARIESDRAVSVQFEEGVRLAKPRRVT